MGMDNQLTQLEYAEKIGVNWPAAKSRLYTRGFSTGKHDPATPDSVAVLNEIKTGKRATVKTAKTKPAVLKLAVKSELQPAQPISEQPKPAQTESDQQAATETNKNRYWFLVVVGIPTAVSVGNIYSVSLSIMQGWIEACLLTAVMSAMGPFLLWLDSKSKTVFALALGLIAFEAFANVARIYYGLMGSGGKPVRFVGTVCEIFNSGTHGTALALAIITSLFIGFVQFVGVNGLKK